MAMQVRGLVYGVFFLFLGFTSTAQATVPGGADLANADMRRHVSQALASGQIFSNFHVGEKSYAVLTLVTAGSTTFLLPTELENVLFERGLFERQRDPVESDGNLLEDYRALFPAEYQSAPLPFELITFHVGDEEEAAPAMAVSEQSLKMKLRVQVQQLQKTFEKENPELSEMKQVRNVMHHFRFQESSDVENSTLLGLTMLLKNLEGNLKRRFETLLSEANLSLPPSVQLERYIFLRYVKAHISPMVYRDLDDALYFQLFEEMERTNLVLKPVRSQVVTSERRGTEQVCTDLGGVIAKYRIKTDEVLLCRFGTAGIGAGTLERYVHSGVQSRAIQTFLAPVPRDESRSKAFRIEWSVEDGRVRPKIVSEMTADELAQDTQDGDAAKPRFFVQLTPKVIQTRHCKASGGFSVPMVDLANLIEQVGCEFNDDSGILGATLYDGPAAPGNAQLVEVLRTIAQRFVPVEAAVASTL